MFCAKCGNELKDGVKFCPKCGAQISKESGRDDDKTEILTVTEVPNIPLTSQEQKKGKAGIKIFSIIALLLVVLGLIGAIVFMFFFYDKEGSSEQDFEGQLRKAEEMMDEEDYEEAIGYYKAALEDNPDSAEVYEGLARAYMQQNRFDQAVKILETGYEVTQEEDLKALLDEIKGKEAEGQEKEGQEGENTGEGESEEKQVYTGVKQDINIEVRQVDNSQFPEVTLYASITDNGGNTVEHLDKTDFNIKEINGNGDVIDASIEDVYQVLNEDKISVNLVLDASGSMDSSNKMQQAKNAANALIDYMEMNKGDQVEVISFDDFVEKSTNEKVASFFKTVQKIAKDNGLSDNSYRIVGNCGEEAGQIVPHFHIHLMGYNLQTKKSK